jgi:integrase
MHGRTPRMKIGSADTVTAAQALERARKLLAKVELGEDPQAEKRERTANDKLTFRKVAGDFIEHKETESLKPATVRMLQSYLLGPSGKRAKKEGIQPYLKPLHALPIDQIARKDVAARLLHVAKQHGPQVASALRGAMSNLFTWAMQMGLTEANPVIAAFKPKPPSRGGKRVLKDDELAAIWKAVGDDDYGKIVKLLILTGCRRNEIGGMRWTEFAEDFSTWALPGARSKNKMSLMLPVTEMMADIIEAIPQRYGIDALFGKNGFTKWEIGKSALKLDLGPWKIQDIRRSVATGMGNLGIQPHVIEAVLNHQSGSKSGVAGIYNKSPYEREVRDAMLRWCDHIRTLVEGGEHKVVPFKSA